MRTTHGSKNNYVKTGRDQKWTRHEGVEGRGGEQNVRMPGQGNAVEKLMISGSGGGQRGEKQGERKTEKERTHRARADVGQLLDSQDNSGDFTTETRENPNE